MCCSWGVCITRRGIVYFGASIHIFVTLILFAGTTFRAYRISTYIREDNRKELLGGVIIASYFFVLLILGCLIFRATEQKNSKLLGWTGGIFITLETFAFVFNLIILSPMGSVYDEYGIRNFGFTIDTTHILISCIFLAFMMAYCGTIIMYISKLKEDGDASHSDYTTYGDFDDPGAAASSKTSSRTPSTYFNQRSQSQSQLDNQKPIQAFGDCKLLSIIAQAKAAQQHQTEPQPAQTQKVKAAKVPSSQVIQTSGLQAPIQTVKTQSISIPQSHTQEDDMNMAHAPEPRTHTQQTQTQVQPTLMHIQQPFHTNHAQQTQYTQVHTPAPPQIHYSQTLPHSHNYQRRMQQEYNMNHQRGPTFPSSPAIVTASVAPNRFRNPNSVARTTAAGTLGRYEPHNHSPIVGSRTHTLQRQNASSSCSSMDHANYDIDQWEQPRVQALKYNYQYNALRRGTHRSDYGSLGVEV